MRVDDFNNQNHCSKTKKGRAMACRLLGADSEQKQLPDP